MAKNSIRFKRAEGYDNKARAIIMNPNHLYRQSSVFLMKKNKKKITMNVSNPLNRAEYIQRNIRLNITALKEAKIPPKTAARLSLRNFKMNKYISTIKIVLKIVDVTRSHI